MSTSHCCLTFIVRVQSHAVESNTVPALFCGVTDQNGELFMHQAGRKVLGDPASESVDEDTVFWLCSQTKLITSVGPSDSCVLAPKLYFVDRTDCSYAATRTREDPAKYSRQQDTPGIGRSSDCDCIRCQWKTHRYHSGEEPHHIWAAAQSHKWYGIQSG